MNSYEVKYKIAEYFRYKRQASLVLFERGLPYCDGNPDVLIVTPERKLIEVEVKVSWADFKNDAKKYKWRMKNNYGHQEHVFYYGAPIELASRIAAVTEHGVIQVGRYQSETLVLKKARRCDAVISHKQFWELVRHQTGTFLSVMRKYIELSKEKEGV